MRDNHRNDIPPSMKKIISSVNGFVDPTHVHDNFIREYDEQVLDTQKLREQIDRIVQAYNAIIICHLDDRIIAWNQGAVALYGWSEEDALGKKMQTLLQIQFPESREAIELTLLREGQWEGGLTHSHRTGTRMIVESRQVLVHLESGQSAVVVVMNRDESERASLVQEHIEATVRELALQKTAQQMNVFVGMVSHELKTPLTSIKGNLQLSQLQLMRLQQQVLHDEVMRQALAAIQTLLDRIDRQVNRQDRLVNDLLDISRIQTHQLNIQKKLCDLVIIVHDVLEDQRIMTPLRLIRWGSLILQAPVLADADRIRQVVNNYLSNALKYSPADTPIDVRLEQEEMMIRVSVRDEGLGISEVQQALIWTQFHRIEESERKSESEVNLGLGLSISRALIEQQGGQVGVESIPACGSTFWFTLPAVSSSFAGERELKP